MGRLGAGVDWSGEGHRDQAEGRQMSAGKEGWNWRLVGWGGVGTLYMGNCLGSMKVTPVRTPSSGDMDSQLAISCCQERLTPEGLLCIQPSHWQRGSHENSQTTRAFAKTKDCSLQTDRGAPLNSLDTEKTGWYLHGAITLVKYLWYTS